jgi:hypothetical protein
MSLIDRFLRAKHWQLFFLCFVTIVVAYIGFFWALLESLSEQTSFGRWDIQWAFGFFFSAIALVIMIILGWLWSIAVGLHHLLPSGMNLSLKRFKLVFCFPVFHFLGSALLLFHSMSMLNYNESPEASETITMVLLFIGMFISNIVAIAALWYCHYFVAKTIKSIQLKKEAVFSDYAGEFFLLLFYPVALWVIQPQVNRIVASSDMYSAESSDTISDSSK